MEQTVITSGSPFDVLALVQGTLGFTPRESLVLVSLRPPRWRTGLVARVDLPDVADLAGASHVARGLARHVAADGGGRCFVAVVSDSGRIPHPRRPGGRPGRATGRRLLPQARLAELVAVALLERGVEPEPWLVHRGRLYSYDCDGPCCPAGGLPMGRVRSTQVAAELVLAGHVLERDRQEWADALRAAVEPAAEEVVAAVSGALARLEAGAGPQTWPGGAGTAAAALATWRSLVSAPVDAGADDLEQRLEPQTAATVLDALSRIPLRDHLLAVLVPQALPACAGCSPARPCLSCSSLRGGADARARPDVDTAVRVLQLLAQRTRPGRRAVPLGCAAYLLWATGAAPAAGGYAEMALVDDPTHSLSDLVLHCVKVGVPPPRDS